MLDNLRGNMRLRNSYSCANHLVCACQPSLTIERILYKNSVCTPYVVHVYVVHHIPYVLRLRFSREQACNSLQT